MTDIAPSLTFSGFVAVFILTYNLRCVCLSSLRFNSRH